MVGLQYLFLEPNPDDPLNKGSPASCTHQAPRQLLTNHSLTEAAEDLRRNRDTFQQNVRSSMRGGSVKGNVFDSVTI